MSVGEVTRPLDQGKLDRELGQLVVDPEAGLHAAGVSERYSLGPERAFAPAGSRERPLAGGFLAASSTAGGELRITEAFRCGSRLARAPRGPGFGDRRR